ncbi:MAG: DUF2809 domain-containing protein [Mariniblastus sp.]|nr:DUF2809 domain-containing protein [Mariniblastus sp.]
MVHRQVSRSRTVCLILAMILAGLGWGVRQGEFASVPVAWRDSLASGLWTGFIYLLWCILLPRLRPVNVLILALLTTFGLEFARLLNPDWLTKIRSFRLGRMVFGSYFNQLDLNSYCVGGMVTFCLDGLVSFWIWLRTPVRR